MTAVLALIARRLAVGVVLVALASVVGFALVAAAGDPLSKVKAQNPPPAPQVLAAEQHRLHTDQSLLPRYASWVGDVVHGRFGPAVDPAVHIGSELRSRLSATLELVGFALVLAFVVAVVAGVIGAVRQSSTSDGALTLVAFVLVSMPAFWFAILLKQAGVGLNHLMGGTVVYTLGSSSPVVAPGFWSHAEDTARHLFLPTVCLALLVYGSWSRYQRASMIEELSADHTQFARAKGLRWRRVVLVHALRNALAPVVAVAMTDIATILGGAVVIEEVFQVHGMGDLLVHAVTDHDLYVVASWLLVAGVLVLVASLVADLLGALLDPNTRHADG